MVRTGARISPGSYEVVDVPSVERKLRIRAEQFAPVSHEIRVRLETALYEPLRAADHVYRLRDLGHEAFHDWGGVHNEVHEVVLVDCESSAQLIAVTDNDQRQSRFSGRV